MKATLANVKYLWTWATAKLVTGQNEIRSMAYRQLQIINIPAQKDPCPGFHSGLCFKQTIGKLSLPQPRQLYCSSVQHVFKYRCKLVVYAFTNEKKKETWRRFLAKMETGNLTEFSLHSYSVPVDFYSHIANLSAQGGFETAIILQGKIVRNGT